ncbi:hypothetical protein DNTS_003272 [Danionella cerebrum]|uniref:Uncharacterized protein n=1 Tax=Danionella cerebrum TaxID=2873325 RepID=A0A553MVK1_9TELE|nr:hypothetical protein DNTS_003272 [Danionella translucida]
MEPRSAVLPSLQVALHHTHAGHAHCQDPHTVECWKREKGKTHLDCDSSSRNAMLKYLNPTPANPGPPPAPSTSSAQLPPPASTSSAQPSNNWSEEIHQKGETREKYGAVAESREGQIRVGGGVGGSFTCIGLVLERAESKGHTVYQSAAGIRAVLDLDPVWVSNGGAKRNQGETLADGGGSHGQGHYGLGVRSQGRGSQTPQI